MRLLLTGIFTASILMGIVAFHRYAQSERYIRADIGAFLRRGAALTVPQCVGEVLSWTKRCQAMLSLCDASVSRMMNACLHGQDRRGYCGSLKVSTADTSFGFRDCKARGVNGRQKKACAASYRMIASFCHHVRTQTTTQATQPNP